MEVPGFDLGCDSTANVLHHYTNPLCLSNYIPSIYLQYDLFVKLDLHNIFIIACQLRFTYTMVKRIFSLNLHVAG